MTLAVKIEPAYGSIRWFCRLYCSARLFATNLLLCVLLSGCSNQTDTHVNEFGGAIMGTRYTVKVVGAGLDTDEQLSSLKEEIYSRLQEVDESMSTYKAESDISRFNRAESGYTVTVSGLTIQVLEEALRLNRKTSGAFDVTVGPLVDLWGFGSKGNLNQVPSQEKVSEALSKVGHSRFTFDKTSQSLQKTQAVEIDLSAIAKGYAVDRVAALLDQKAIKNYLVEVGGEIRVSGRNPKGRKWSLGVELPDSLARRAHSIVELDSGAMATSGDYRNYYELDGQRWSHSIDPDTGFPVRHKLASVSIIAETCAEADGLATGLMVMGEDGAYEFALEHGLAVMLLVRSGEGFEVKVTPQFNQFLVKR